MISVTIDATDWDQVADDMITALGGEDAKPVRRAITRALRKTARWVNARIARSVAQAANIPQKAVRARLSVRVGKEEAMVWLGTNPIPAHRLGTVRWSRRMRGARAGRRLFPGSFAWGPNPDKPLVWHRTGKSRLPIEKETVEIDPVAQEQARRLRMQALKRLREVLRQELNYELLKATGAVS